MSVRRFEDMYFRGGVINDRINGMEWMNPDYDTRTFKDLTENAFRIC